MKPFLLALVACVVLYTDRFPLDDLEHVELRVRLCARYSGPVLVVESRSYARWRSSDGYRYSRLTREEDVAQPDDTWWQISKEVPLYVTTDPGATK